ncbi:hypothetical protein ACVWWP_005032 [Bradyrhizobium sp. LM3.6]
MIRIVFATAIALLLGTSAGQAQVATTGSTAMDLPTVPGAIVISPLNSPGPFSATTVPGAPDTTLAPVPLASDPTTPGDGRRLRSTVVIAGAGAGDSDGIGHGPFDIGHRSSDPAGHGTERQLHRDCLRRYAGGNRYECRMQLNAGRAGDKRCVPAAFGTASGCKPRAWHDPGRHRRRRRHWHRPERRRCAQPKQLGLRGRGLDESGGACDGVAGQRLRRSTDAGRVADPSAGMLRRNCRASVSLHHTAFARHVAGRSLRTSASGGSIVPPSLYFQSTMTALLPLTVVRPTNVPIVL